MPPAFSKVHIPDKVKQLQQSQQQEKELRHLSRQYAALDIECSTHFSGDNYPKLSKTSRILKIFQNDYENILNDLSVAISPGNKRNDNIQADRLQDLIQTYDDQREMVKVRNIQMKELEGQISDTAKSVQSLKKDQITQHQYQDYLHGARQTLERLENQLETQMKKFNMIVAENAHLRDDLDLLLADRRIFLRVWETLINKLNNGKHIMLDLIQQASIAYDQRDEWCSRLQLLRTTGHKDYITNSDKMRNYNSRVDKMMKLVEFLDTKDQKRVMADLYKKEKLRRANLQKALEDKLHVYQKMMSDIQEFTKQTKLVVIVRGYFNVEADNFSNFKQIINLIGEMEEGDDKLSSLRENIDVQKKLHVARVAQQKRILEKLEVQLEKEIRETQQEEAELHQLEQYLDEMMTGVMKLFKMCKCNQDPILKLLGHNTGIGKYNVLLYCRILEQTIHRCLIQAAAKVKAPEKKTSTGDNIFNDDKSGFKIYTIDKIVMDTPCSLCVQHEFMSDIIDKVERPFNKVQALERLKQRLQLPNCSTIVHNLSKCHLPEARQIIQKAYE